MFEFECNTCICLEIFDISRESLVDELLVPYISPTMSNNQINIIRFGSISRMKYKHCLEILNMSRNIMYGDLGPIFELYQLTDLKEACICHSYSLGVDILYIWW
jgi:hypothetical protein